MSTAPQITNMKAEVLKIDEQDVPEQIVQKPPMTPATESSIEKLRVDLDQLVRLGRIDREIDIQGIKFGMSTISSLENTKVLEAVSGIEDIDVKVSHMRKEVLGRAINSINEIPLELLYKENGNGKKLDNIEKKVNIVNSWQQIIINELWNKYNEMVEASEKIAKQTEGPALKN